MPNRIGEERSLAEICEISAGGEPHAPTQEGPRCRLNREERLTQTLELRTWCVTLTDGALDVADDGTSGLVQELNADLFMHQIDKNYCSVAT